MQKCQMCKRILEDGEQVVLKCIGTYEIFSAGIHRAIPEDIEAIWCLKCEEEND